MAVALLALFFALGGTSLAARHYLLTDSSQISPKLLRKLEGRKGREGPRGLPGAEGPTGSAGAAGAAGPPGEFSGALASGRTLRGVFGASSSGGIGYSSISFDGYTLPAGVAINFIEVEAAVPPACAGGTVELPQALPGNLCIFVAFDKSLAAGAFDPATESPTTSGRGGVIVFSESQSGQKSDTEGSWAMTAP
jgi:hypothetical protein